MPVLIIQEIWNAFKLNFISSNPDAKFRVDDLEDPSQKVTLKTTNMSQESQDYYQSLPYATQDMPPYVYDQVCSYIYLLT